MNLFNKHVRARTLAEQILNDMTNELDSTSRTSPYFSILLRSIESLQMSIHRARILGLTTTNTNQGVSMTVSHVHQAPVFSTNLVLRRLQYQEYVVANGDYTIEEVLCMSMRELRIAIDELCPTTITIRTAQASGGVSTTYIAKKAA